MERDINIEEITNQDHWPQAFQFMVGDLTRSIRDAKANYLVALGLFCYSEIMGRSVLRFRAKEQKKRFDNKECFDIFARDYLGYGDILDNNPNTYEIFRHGLCHGFYIKVDHPDGGSGVFVYYSDDELYREKMQHAGVDFRKGIAISQDGKKRVLVIEPYLNEFIRAVDRVSEEMWNSGWNPEIGLY